MRAPMDWLREYVEIPADARGVDVAADLVRVGLEEEGIHGGGVVGPLVVGRVVSKEPEPQKNGKTINWCSVDVGPAPAAVERAEGTTVGIVCGAHNFEVGDLVAVILPGGELPGGFVISARKTYGHVSNGMICSVQELGIGDDHDGILVLTDRPDAADLSPGDNAIPLLGLDRETIEVNVTPDRGYCFSLRGLAREYANSTGATFTDPALTASAAAPTVGAGGYPVRIEDDAPIRGTTGCDRFVARVVRGIDAAAPSPTWMQTRLTEAGMRPISLVVDVTNYVMLALGQPLHAYDLGELAGDIVVRRARPGERLTTLDDAERALDVEDLLITEAGGRVLGIAGVMGGADTEVSESTRDVLIEAAHFDPLTVARSARRHRLPSEASKRFERGVDTALAPAAAQLAVQLLIEHGGGVADDGMTDLDTTTAPTAITLRPERVSNLVGVDYSTDRVGQILRAIGCDVRAAGEALEVTPPTWRPDLTTWPDLAEEVARIDGYDRIPSVVPAPPGGRGLTSTQSARRMVAAMLAGRGLFEVWAAPFVSAQLFDDLGYASEDPRRATLRVANPLSDEEPLLRTTLLPSVLESVRRNVARGARDVALFEQGLVLGSTGGQAKTYDVGVYPGDAAIQELRDAVPAQPRHVAWALAGASDRRGWWGPARSADWSDAVAVGLDVAEALGVRVTTAAAAEAPFHPGRCAALALNDGTVVGHAGELHPKAIQRLGLPERTVGGELNLDALMAARGPVQFGALSNFPHVESDVALVVSSQIPAAKIEAALREGAGEMLERIELFDVFTGDQVGAGKTSLAYRMLFRSPDRTLKTEEVNAFRDKAVQRAAEQFGAVQRA